MEEAPHDQAHDADRLIDELIEREGGFVNHPGDRGGATRFGIEPPKKTDFLSPTAFSLPSRRSSSTS